jgi:hypothetical protein
MASSGYLQDASTIVMALKFDKDKINQITTLVKSYAFPKVVAVESSLANERP